MPGNRVSDGTRFPVSNSCATGLFSSLDTFEDQIVPFAWLRRTRFPLLLLAKTPCGSRIGVFLLATQTLCHGSSGTIFPSTCSLNCQEIRSRAQTF
ncbi:hypothetical protein CUMW_163570, partial [Citrus unshiu]